MFERISGEDTERGGRHLDDDDDGEEEKAQKLDVKGRTKGFCRGVKEREATFMEPKMR